MSRLATLRGLLLEHVTAEKWQHILDFLLAWPEDDEKQAALDYTRGHLSDWLTLTPLLDALAQQPAYWPVLQELTNADLLVQLLFDGAVPDRWRAMRAIREEDIEEVIPQLQSRLEAESKLIRHWAILALGELGGWSAGLVLVETQIGEDDSLIRAAGRALGYLSGKLPAPRREALLHKLLEQPPTRCLSRKLFELMRAQPQGKERNALLEHITTTLEDWPDDLKEPLRKELSTLRAAELLLLPPPNT